MYERYEDIPVDSGWYWFDGRVYSQSTGLLVVKVERRKGYTPLIWVGGMMYYHNAISGTFWGPITEPGMESENIT